MTGFGKSICQSISKSLHVNFNPSQNISPILLPNCSVMVTNERSIACRHLI